MLKGSLAEGDRWAGLGACVLAFYVLHQTGCRLGEACHIALRKQNDIFGKQNPQSMVAPYDAPRRILTTGMKTKTTCPLGGKAYQYTVPVQSKIFAYLGKRKVLLQKSGAEQRSPQQLKNNLLN